jgi:hypothetical protein
MRLDTGNDIDPVTLMLDLGLAVNDPRLTLNERIDAWAPSYEMNIGFDFPGEGQIKDTEYDEMTGHSHTTTFPFRPKDWLRVANGGKELSLVGLQSLRNQLGPLPLAEAAQVIQGKIDASVREITIGGVSVDSRLVFWIVPLAIWMVLAYLLLHISHALHLRTISDADRATLRTFPWVGLFPALPPDSLPLHPWPYFRQFR